jgi:hypothetical protein
MCPGCIAGVTWAIVGATSTGGVAAALVTMMVRTKERSAPRRAAVERDSNAREEIDA